MKALDKRYRIDGYVRRQNNIKAECSNLKVLVSSFHSRNLTKQVNKLTASSCPTYYYVKLLTQHTTISQETMNLQQCAAGADGGPLTHCHTLQHTPRPPHPLAHGGEGGRHCYGN